MLARESMLALLNKKPTTTVVRKGFNRFTFKTLYN
jgi:hypothetical protein